MAQVAPFRGLPLHSPPTCSSWPDRSQHMRTPSLGTRDSGYGSVISESLSGASESVAGASESVAGASEGLLRKLKRIFRRKGRSPNLYIVVSPEHIGGDADCLREVVPRPFGPFEVPDKRFPQPPLSPEAVVAPVELPEGGVQRERSAQSATPIAALAGGVEVLADRPSRGNGNTWYAAAANHPASSRDIRSYSYDTAAHRNPHSYSEEERRLRLSTDGYIPLEHGAGRDPALFERNVNFDGEQILGTQMPKGVKEKDGRILKLTANLKFRNNVSESGTEVQVMGQQVERDGHATLFSGYYQGNINRGGNGQIMGFQFK
ncbi:hypothetical protein F4808DRAFT_385702 [Astrocystis sublimbata]|nr:hypothetical protein F4808DRAFT_385702 [Astrocystis sublimbata]